MNRRLAEIHVYNHHALRAYSHVAPELQQELADRMGRILWRNTGTRRRPCSSAGDWALGATAMACAQPPAPSSVPATGASPDRGDPRKQRRDQHSMLAAILHMGAAGTRYDDPEGVNFTRFTLTLGTYTHVAAELQQGSRRPDGPGSVARYCHLVLKTAAIRS